jgi:hypothetical protein
VGYLTDIEPVKEVVDRMVRQTEEVLGRWSGR